MQLSDWQLRKGGFCGCVILETVQIDFHMDLLSKYVDFSYLWYLYLVGKITAGMMLLHWFTGPVNAVVAKGTEKPQCNLELLPGRQKIRNGFFQLQLPWCSVWLPSIPCCMDPIPQLLNFQLHQRLILHLVSAVGEGSCLLLSSQNMLWSVFQTKNFLLNLTSKVTPDLKEILWDPPHLPCFCSQFLKIFLTFCIDFSFGRVGTGCTFSEQHTLGIPKRYMNSSLSGE